MKFGGSSVSSALRIKQAALIVGKLIDGGNKVVVVTSAMQGMTGHLIDLTKNFSNDSFDREYDAVISVGEQVAAGLFAMALNSMDFLAKSMSAWQAQIKSDGEFSDGFVVDVEQENILECLQNNITPVVAGFQGVSLDGDVQTIGRGGSDATACAVAHSIGADECLIYTDVDGVYTADPRIVLGARRISCISYDEMLEMASGGARVLQSKSVLIAKKYNIKLKVLSSFCDSGETVVCDHTKYILQDKKITGIAHNTSMVKILISSVSMSVIDVLNSVCQNSGKLELLKFLESDVAQASFLFPKSAVKHLKNVFSKMADVAFSVDNDIGVVTLVGSGVKTEQSILADVLHILSSKKILVKQISVSEVSIAVVVSFGQVEKVVNLLHDFFFI